MLTAEPFRQMQAAVAALARVDFCFDRRRCRRQHHRTFDDAAAHHRHVARMIMRAVFLFIGLVVLFIDDDQRQVGIG